jgi:dihydroflavonol-4-reductase
MTRKGQTPILVSMKVAITGATGHIGANLTRALLAQGMTPRVLVRKNLKPIANLPLDLVEGDVRDPATLDKLFDGVDVVYHLAAYISIASGADSGVQLNVDGPRAVVDACLRNGVKRLVHFSSVHALHAPPAGQTIAEDAELADHGDDLPYDRSKAEGEKVVQAGIARGLDAVICSPSGVIGPNDFSPSFMGDALIRMHDGRLPGLVDGAYNFVHVADVVAGAMAAAQHGRVGQRYLLTGHHLTVPEIGRLMTEATGRPAPRLVTPMWLAQASAPVGELWAKLNKTQPLYTSASLKILRANCQFERTNTERDLGYTVRPPLAMVRDALAWFHAAGMLQRPPMHAMAEAHD